MNKGTLWSHVGWAAVAMGAFALGAMRDRGNATDATRSGPGASSKSSGAGRTAGGDFADSPAGAVGTASRRQGESSNSGSDEGDRSRTGTLSEAQLAALAQDAFRSGNPLDRRTAFGKILESLTPENAGTILGLLKENKADKEEWRDFHYAWGMIDGEAAVKHAMESPDYDMAFTMSGWASANPEAARQFLDNLPEDVKTDRGLLKRSLVAGMADRDTNLATDFVLQLSGRGDQGVGELLGVVTEEVLRKQGPEDAALWSQGLPDGAMKGEAMDRVANAYVDRDPQAAAAWAEQFAGQEYAARVIEEVGDEWAERDPVSAVGWLETLPNGNGKNSGLSSAFGEWSERDPVAAGERIASMPRSPERDYAMNGYARTIARRDPAAAIEWANSIADDGLRANALTRAGQSLFRRDAEAARNWVASSGLPPESQKEVLNPPQGR